MIGRGMEKGLLYVEENHVLVLMQDYQQKMIEKGIFPQFGGQLGDGTGFGMGLTWVPGGLDPGRPATAIQGAASFKGYALLHLYHQRPAWLGPVGVRFGGRYYHAPQEDFFGIGQDSRQENRTTYKLDELVGYVNLDLPVGEGLRLTSTGRLRRTITGPGTDHHFPATGEVFPPETLPGLDQTIDMVHVDATLVYTHRDPFRFVVPWEGREELSFSVYEAVDGQYFGYQRLQLTITRQIPLYLVTRRLAFRALGVLTNRHAEEEAAFFDLPELGGSDTMRGFRERRFRDRDALLFNLEYRWPLGGIMEMALFVDEGSVFENIDSDFTWRALRTSYGASFRLRSTRGVFFRTSVGRSNEGTRWFFKFGAPAF
jgi:hypothetical protein